MKYEEELSIKFWKGFLTGYFTGIAMLIFVHWLFT